MGSGGFLLEKETKPSFFSSSVGKKIKKQKKKPKTSWLGGRLAVSWKAEMNSLRSDNISALSSKNQPASKDPLVRNVFMTSTSTSTITSTITLTGTLCGMF
jgi:hypothetical protein